MIFYKFTYFWPDGLFSKLFINSKIIPGRIFINNIKNSRNFDSVYLIGTIQKKKLDYLKNKFVNKKIISINVPHTNIDNIITIVKTFDFKKKSLIIINLPTPKQELLAVSIAQNNKHFKIICSGGAVDYNSGTQIMPPKIISKYHLESFWRLQYDTYRRIHRLFFSFFIFTKNYLLKNYDQYSFKNK
jgi:UDP-N-acetyl-D-mannosaminuronic acid transferase (WecB/TagA/CpsF family)